MACNFSDKTFSRETNHFEIYVGHNVSAPVYQRVSKYESLCGDHESLLRMQKSGKLPGLVDVAYGALLNTPI
jgi:hypothetical protein